MDGAIDGDPPAPHDIHHVSQLLSSVSKVTPVDLFFFLAASPALLGAIPEAFQAMKISPWGTWTWSFLLVYHIYMVFLNIGAMFVYEEQK